MGLHANIYRSGHLEHKRLGVMIVNDCTNNGWSGNFGFDHVCIVNADGPFEPDEQHPAVLVLRHQLARFNTLHVVSVIHYEARHQTMFGGNFLYSSDSRFGELCIRMMTEGHYSIQTNAVHWSIGAIPIHDRVE